MAFILDLTFSSLLPVALLLLTLFIWFYASSKPQQRLPPSPSKFPVVGNLFQLGLYPHRKLQSLSRKYGSLMLVHFGSKPVVVASSADAACEIMRTHDLVFANRPKTSMNDRLLYGSKDIAFSPYGEYWRQVRSICVLQLLSHKRVQSFRNVREEETSLMVEKIRNFSASSPPLSAINLSDLLMTLTNDVICRVALGRKYSDREDGSKSMQIMKEFIELLGTIDIGDFVPWLGWLRHLNDLDDKVDKVVKQLDEFLEGVIKEHKDMKNGKANTDDSIEGKGSDLVDILLEIQGEKSTGFILELDSLKAIILDMFAAGTDTTHTVMEWAMTELLRHPKILEKLQTEVRQVAQGKPEITEDDLDKMDYLKAVIKETLRLHTPIPLLVPRESTQHVKLMGYDIPAGTRVMVNAWAIARDPSLWNQPEEFQPERFLNSTIDFRGFNFELIPFGAGRRGCPGTTFAVAVNELALAKLVHKFDFALPDGVEPKDLDMSESTGLTIHRKNPLFAVAIPHSG
ncbi:cytochrome P450 71A3-like [Coffea eugenioides]|uniref:cytochrome P450 71A3-like n=2 Tax=Coffea eugenioides TaxID=49369 RepID=UPI000F6072F9|nr:cytochrome P450 71A3-like [Coffea eugenioides]